MAPYGIHLDPNKAVIDIIAAAFIMAVMMAHHRKTSHPTNLNQLPKGARKKRIRACFTPYLQESSPAIEFPVGEKLGKQFQKKMASPSQA